MALRSYFAVVEELVCEVRRRFPAWGGRKIRGFLLRQRHVGVPAASTITQILRRNGLMSSEEPPRQDFLRTEACRAERLVADGLQRFVPVARMGQRGPPVRGPR